MKIIFLFLTGIAGCAVALVLGALFYVGVFGPEVFVVSGRQMNKAHTEIIQELNLLEEAENIQYFYSDALINIRKGMYFVTDRKLVLYNMNWEEPSLVAPFSIIVDTEVEFNDSFFDDSYINITLDIGEVWTFPVSSDRGNDKVFYEYLTSKIARPSGKGISVDGP